MSALTYQGTYPGIALRFSGTGRGITQEVGLSGAVGKLRAKSSANTLQSKVAGLDYRILFAVKETGSIRCHLGAALDNYFNLRENEQYVNNRDYYEFISSVGPVLKFKYAATKNCEVSTALFYPFMSALSASYTAYEEQAGLHTPSFRTVTKHIRLAGWNELSRIQWSTGLKMKMHKNNSISFNYQWEYYKVKAALPVQSAAHHLTFNYIFLL